MTFVIVSGDGLSVDSLAQSLYTGMVSGSLDLKSAVSGSRLEIDTTYTTFKPANGKIQHYQWGLHVQ